MCHPTSCGQCVTLCNPHRSRDHAPGRPHPGTACHTPSSRSFTPHVFHIPVLRCVRGSRGQLSDAVPRPGDILVILGDAWVFSVTSKAVVAAACRPFDVWLGSSPGGAACLGRLPPVLLAPACLADLMPTLKWASVPSSLSSHPCPCSGHWCSVRWRSELTASGLPSPTLHDVCDKQTFQTSMKSN